MQDGVRQLLEYLPDLIFCFDVRLQCTYVNRSVEQASGLSRAEMHGRSYADIVGPPQVGRLWEAALRRVLDAATVERLEVPAEWSGVERQYHVVLIPQPF